MQKLKFFVVVFAILILDLPLISAAKHRKQGSATTRGPAPTQAATHAPQPTQSPNSDPSKLSYGNQGPPPQAGWNTNNQNHGPPPSYQQSQQHAPPQYSQNQPSYQGGQPGYQPGGAGQQPVIINHVQQPQSSSGGLGVGSGLAIGS